MHSHEICTPDIISILVCYKWNSSVCYKRYPRPYTYTLFPFIPRLRRLSLSQSGMAFAISINFIWNNVFECSKNIKLFHFYNISASFSFQGSLECFFFWFYRGIAYPDVVGAPYSSVAYDGWKSWLLELPDRWQLAWRDFSWLKEHALAIVEVVRNHVRQATSFETFQSGAKKWAKPRKYNTGTK